MAILTTSGRAALAAAIVAAVWTGRWPAAAVLLTAAGVTILKRRQSGDHGSARHSA